MPIQVIWLLVPLALVAAGIAVARLASGWLRYRGARVIECPETCRPAGVHLNARHAAASTLFGTPELRLADCSRWPERAGCGQQCLAQIEASPAACLVRNILADWYRGKVCASCGRPFGEIEWAAQKPALLCAAPSGGASTGCISVDWSEVPAEKLREILQTAAPLCFACHMASSLVREHPELATDRGPAEARRTSS